MRILRRRSAGLQETSVIFCPKQIELDGYASHVSDPRPPNVLCGMSPSKVLDFHEGKIKRVGKGRGKGKGLRKDSPTLVAAVFSFPYPTAEKTDANYIALRDKSIAFFGSRLRAAAAQSLVQSSMTTRNTCTSISTPWTSPTLNYRQKNLHRGHVAAAAVRAQGKKGITEFNEAMRSFQDDYNTQVTQKYGLLKLGPRVQRISHAEWRERWRRRSGTRRRFRQSRRRKSRHNRRKQRRIMRGTRRKAP